MKVVFDNVSKHYGSITALKNLNFEVNSGEFVFIEGPSGSGKSTILKLILHQIHPSTGKIYINDIDYTKSKKTEIESIRKNIGVIFQNYQLISDKSVEENIALNLEIIGIPEYQIGSRIEDVLKKVNLLSRRHLFPGQLSGGELQRAALARALSVEPKLILADEPTGNLDIDNAWNLLKLFKQINEKSGTTIIMTTHNQEIVNSLNKRSIYLKEGEIIKDSIKKNEKS
jgi:cell division transport system ATP-binding protein